MRHHWDFFGSDAQKTALHMQKHVHEFAVQLRIEIHSDGFFNVDPHHTCFWVEITRDEDSAELEKRLRPKRSMTDAEHIQLLAQLTSTSAAPEHR